MTESTHNIVDTAIAAGNFTTLANALKAADLVGTLTATGPFTVFAPTDDAFKKLPAGALDGLLKDKAKLTSLLKDHVVAGKVMSKDIKSTSVKSVEGNMLTIATSTEGVTVNGAKVVKADVECSNGVIHAIDTVMLPK
ncbi:MAG: fasciclin domain-containing protein [Betaproteobacteria bacterium]|nr:fasciclin domain-containing protein [Betaproteobacteria bacterium]MDE2047434.1 fasciclin domain-containing protein [Betaproteobacteria bacterium]